MRFATYATLSTLLMAGVVYYAQQTRVQFFPAVVFLATSKFSILVMCNMALVLTLLVGKAFKRAFFGTLRDGEVEAVMSNAPFAIIKTCLALTIFREELTVRVGALFTALLFAKVFQWLAEARLESVEVSEEFQWRVHARLLTLILVLLAVDTTFVVSAVSRSHVHGDFVPSVLILFGFEFLVLAIQALSTLIRFGIHIVDLRTEGVWHDKSTYIFYLELFTDVQHMFIYLLFFGFVFVYYGAPIHIVRDIYVAFRNLHRRLSQFIRYRRIAAVLNERYPDATPEELAEQDCVICRDHMDAGKKLPCGHIFHFYCLRTWLEQQQNCPTCREPVDPYQHPRRRRRAGTEPEPDLPPVAAPGVPVAPNAAAQLPAAPPVPIAPTAPAGPFLPGAAAPTAPATAAAAAALPPGTLPYGAAPAWGLPGTSMPMPMLAVPGMLPGAWPGAPAPWMMPHAAMGAAGAETQAGGGQPGPEAAAMQAAYFAAMAQQMQAWQWAQLAAAAQMQALHAQAQAGSDASTPVAASSAGAATPAAAMAPAAAPAEPEGPTQELRRRRAQFFERQRSQQGATDAADAAGNEE